MSCNKRINKNMKELKIELYDIAFKEELIPKHQKYLFKKIEKLPSCISKHCSIQLLKEKLPKVNTRNRVNIKEIKESVTIKSLLKNEIKEESIVQFQQKDKNESNVNINIIETRQYKKSHLNVIRQKQHLVIQNSNQSSSNEQDNEIHNTMKSFVTTRSMSANTKKYSGDRKPIIKKRKNSSSSHVTSNSYDMDISSDISAESIKVKVDSNDTQCLDKKNLTFIDCNSKIEEIPGKTFIHVQCGDHLLRFNFTKRRDSKIKHEQYKKYQSRQVDALTMNNTNIENDEIFINKTPEYITTDSESEDSYESDNFLAISKISDKQDQQNMKQNSNNKSTSPVDTIIQAVKCNVKIKEDAVMKSPIKYTINDKNNIQNETAYVNPVMNNKILFHTEIQNKSNISKDNKNFKETSCEEHISNDLHNDVLKSISLKSVDPISNKSNDTIEISSNSSKICNENESAISKQNVLKITRDEVLPKGTVKIIKINEIDTGFQNSAEDISFTQNSNDTDRNSNDTDRNIKQAPHVNDMATSNFRVKDHTSPEKKEDIYEVPNISTLENNIISKDKNISDNGLYSKIFDHKDLNSSILKNNTHININNTKVTINRDTLNYKIQANRLYNDVDMLNNASKNIIQNKNDILQNNRHCEEVSTKVLNEEITNSMNMNESCNINQRSEISVTKEKDVQWNRKRTTKDNVNCNTDTKRIKLVRSWVRSNTMFTQSNNHQQFNDSPNIDATKIESNMSIECNIECNTNMSKNIECNTEIDLRQHLNKKREKTYKMEITSDCNNEINAIWEKNNFHDNSNIVENEAHATVSLKKKLSIKEVLYEENDNVQLNTNHNNDLLFNKAEKELNNMLQETQCTEIDKNIHKDPTVEETDDINDDDDYISIYAESIDFNQFEDTFSNEKDKSCKSLHTDTPYVMTASSFDTYVKHNTNEFNKEYAECLGDKNKISDKSNITKGAIFEQHMHNSNLDNIPVNLNNISAPVLATNLSPTIKNKESSSLEEIRKIFYGTCYVQLRCDICQKKICHFNHNIRELYNKILSKDFHDIVNIMKYSLYSGYYFFNQMIYTMLFSRLNNDQILIIYKLYRDTYAPRIDFLHDTVIELLNRKMSLKNIVENLTIIVPVTKQDELLNILKCTEKYVKPGQYWDTLKNIILMLKSNKDIIENTLRTCIKSEELSNIQDINDSLISKLHPTVMSILDEGLMARFKGLLIEKIVKNSCPTTSILNFGENLITESIASPDSIQSPSQENVPLRYNITFTNETDKSKNQKYTQVITNISYKIQPIDDLPEPRSIYRNHNNLWKFYVHLYSLKQGLAHEDYDYVIDILEKYTVKQNENPLFIRSCCNILRTEIKRSEYHLTNIMRRTGEILFDIGLDILANLVNKEAWGLAMRFIQSINIYNLMYDAKLVMLSAEIYLANKKAIKALDLLKYKNIICTSRAKWRVKSTITDERIRKKIIYILMDLLCSEFIEYAYFLFEFLIKDQCSLYYPIGKVENLSRYVDKLIMLILSKNDTSLIAKVGDIIFKYNFTLNKATCRALISTLTHIDITLAKQLHNYAQAIGIYPAMKLWPVIQVTINTDLTEEEIYLIFLHLLERLAINFGHTIEFIKYRNQITVYLIFEVKTNKKFYRAELQNYYNKLAISNIKTLVRSVLKKQFDPPLLLMKSSKDKGRICRLQIKSLLNYLESEHCS